MADTILTRSPGANRFGGSVLDNLTTRLPQRQSISQAQRIALDLIDEDPDQPRRTFDATALEGLAASIAMVGVLQPVGVTQAANGRYVLRWGARRFRASRLAGLTDIPAALVSAAQTGLEAQVIENQQRAPVANSDLAAAIALMTERGLSNANIATAVALPEQSLKHYRALSKVRAIPALAAHIDRPGTHIRALYEVQSTWHRADANGRDLIERALSTLDELTVAEGRRVILVTQGSPQSNAAPLPENATPKAIAAQRSTAPPRPVDVDAERVAIVRAWLADDTRPRPPLSV